MWWILGVEQFILLIFVSIEAIRHLFRKQGVFTINPAFVFSLFLSLWSAIPSLWITPDQVPVFLKGLSSTFAMTILIGLFISNVRSADEWWVVAKGLMVFAAYFATAAVLYVFGIWRGTFRSGMGRVLPNSLLTSSAFFDSIGMRSFGGIEESLTDGTSRLSALALDYGGLASIIIILLPFVFWYGWQKRRLPRWIFSAIFIGLVLALVFAQVRSAYLTLAISLIVWFALTIGRRLRGSVALGLIVAIVAIITILSISYFASAQVQQLFQEFFVNWRRGSWNVRIVVYRETLRLLPKHWVAGWGLPVRIPFLRSDFSAGTHSSYLGMLFQHGIVGLLLYLGLLGSIWLHIVRGLRRKALFYSFWAMATATMISFNLREAVTTWWWDQSITVALWVFWGLILTTRRFEND
ncbi:MAG: O-antigen ligase family protein [Anaerolineae bacterium]|nr:O-antigen ligase family protein [Anaerolineae bacterium]